MSVPVVRVTALRAALSLIVPAVAKRMFLVVAETPWTTMALANNLSPMVIVPVDVIAPISVLSTENPAAAVPTLTFGVTVEGLMVTLPEPALMAPPAVNTKSAAVIEIA